MSTLKIELSKIAEAAKQIALPPEQTKKLLEMLADMQPEEKEPVPHVKKQYAILVSDPEGRLAALGKLEFVGWVLQIPDSEAIATAEDRIRCAAYDFNASKEGRLLPVQTVGEAVENIPARFFKEADVWVKTKTPVLVLRTDNEIPKTPGVLADDNRGSRAA